MNTLRHLIQMCCDHANPHEGYRRKNQKIAVQIFLLQEGA